MNIFRMAREGLRGDLTIALHRAVSLGNHDAPFRFAGQE